MVVEGTVLSSYNGVGLVMALVRDEVHQEKWKLLFFTFLQKSKKSKKKYKKVFSTFPDV